MSSLPTQPYQVSDFAGGLTENFIAGGPTRYMAADNLLVTVDRKLEERFGSILYPGYPQLPGGTAPVNALMPHDNEAYLLGVQCPNIYVLNSGWQGILGPTGNPPLSGGNYQNQISWSEWSHHSLITDDSLATTPIKIYRGAAYPTSAASAPTTFPFMAVTAGLPALTSTQNISNSLLLQNCCTLANDIANQLGNHIQDFGSTLNTNLHHHLDTTAYAYINPGTLTPATTLPTLINVVTQLILAYQEHVADVIVNWSSPSYHWGVTGTPTPLNFYLSTVTPPTTLLQCATILDDLKTKFYMHEMAIYTHDSHQSYSLLAQHLVTTPHIGTITTGPVLNPSYTQSLALAADLITKITAHVSDTTYHIVADTVDEVSFPAPVDLDTLYTSIVWMRYLYADHWNDSNLTHNVCLGNSTTGGSSTQITGLTLAGSTFTPSTGQTIWDSVGTVFPKSDYPVTASSPSAGGCTASVAFSSIQTGYTFDFTFAKYHISQNTDATAEQLINGGQNTVYPPNAANLSNWISLLTQLQNAYNAHDSNSAVHITSGLHLSSQAQPTIASYAYGFHYFYQYMRYDGVIFNVVGPPLLVGPVQTEAISPSYQTQSSSGVAQATAAVTLSITNIPPLVNGSQSNYDTANVQVSIYRTINAGSTYYLDSQIANGATSFTDVTPDVVNTYLPSVTPLNVNPVIYTSGGVVNYDPAPICKYITIMQNTAYFGAIIDTGQTFLNRIRQSVPGQIDSAPRTFYVDMPDVLMGLSNTRNNLIALCLNSVYLVAGTFNQLGQGQMTYQSISDTIGCVSSESIVRTDVGIFFAGTDGFYYTDGFQLIKLSSENNNTYLSLVSTASQKQAIYGCYDRYNRRVWWSTQPNPSDWSATQSWIFHVNFGVTAMGVFTTASNFENYRPSSMIFWQGNQIRGDARGYVFLHTILSKTDPQVNTAISTTLWNTVYIPYNYSSCMFDFGTTFNRKWLTRVALQGKNVGNVAAQITSVSDNGRVKPLTLSPIYFRKNLWWGKPNVIWGAPNSSQPITWGDDQQVDAWRRFPATQLRADYKQLIIQPAKVGVYRYQDWPVGAAAYVAPQGGGVVNVQLLTPSTYTSLVWPSDVVGYVFATQIDGFVAEYSITGLTTTTHTNDTLILSDPENVLEAGYVAWIIRGVLKQQRLSLTSYNIHFTLLGKASHAFQGPQDAGENAPGTVFNGDVGEGPLTDDSGDPLTDDNGNPLTS